MSRVRSTNTEPERAVRSILHSAGLRFRLHQKALPGSPDIVLRSYHTVVFVHGCFWHSHSCARGRRPTTNADFWREKLDRNAARDKENAKKLKTMGWRVETVWACSLERDSARIIRRLKSLRA